LAFCYDSDIDYWLDRAYFSNNTAKTIWFNKIVEKIQTELNPMVYLTQRKVGVFLWDEWEIKRPHSHYWHQNLSEQK